MLKRRPPVILWMLAVVGVFAAISPLAYLIIRLGEYGAEKVIGHIFRVRSFELLTNSLVLTLMVGATAIILGSFQAWLATRTRIRGRAVYALLAALPLAMPSYITAYAFTALLPDFKGFWAAWIVLSLGTTPYVYLAVSAALVRSDSATEDVARSLGLGRLQVFKRVTWPSIRPAAVGGMMLSALYTLSDFGAVSILGFDTFTRAIYNAYRSSFDRSAAASLALILVLLTLLLLVIEPILRGPSVPTDSRSKKTSHVHLGGWSFFAHAAVIGWATLGILIPVVSLIRWNLAGLSSVNFDEVLRALVNSIGYALGGGAITAIFGLAISVLAVRHASKLSTVATRMIWLTHAVPGIVVALSLVFLSNQLLPSIYQTSLLVLIAYLILFLPNAVVTMQTPISQAPKALDEVAASLGATKTQILRRVVLPIATPGILAGAALVALSVLKELPATLLLRETGVETLATRLWGQTSVAAFAGAAPYALLLVVAAGIPAWWLNRQVRANINQQINLDERMERE